MHEHDEWLGLKLIKDGLHHTAEEKWSTFDSQAFLWILWENENKS